MQKLYSFMDAHLVILVVVISLFIASSPALSNEAKVIGKFSDWQTYVRGDKKDRFSYIVSKPKKASLRSRRGDIFLMVWHRPSTKEFDVVQVDAGYTYKKKSEVKLKVGSSGWTLFTRGGNAWALGKDDASIVKAMSKGMRLTIKGTSSRNNPTTDSYSLKGVTAAHRAMNKACGRK